jgi:CheY-like chemotaxis protein
MDIHMPVMDGIEAAGKMIEMGCKSPIAALTANIMPSNRSVYKQAGMVDYLGKPFTTQELWHCLLRHITPLSSESTNDSEQHAAEQKLLERLRIHFMEDNQATMEELTGALEAGDVKTAHGLVHTLKSVAALIGKNELRNAALSIEYSLLSEQEVSRAQLKALGSELNAALREFALMAKAKPLENEPIFIPKAEALARIEALEPKIIVGDLDCLDSIEALQGIPGTGRLIHQLEHLEFALARETLAEIKEALISPKV